MSLDPGIDWCEDNACDGFTSHGSISLDIGRNLNIEDISSCTLSDDSTPSKCNENLSDSLLTFINNTDIWLDNHFVGISDRVDEELYEYPLAQPYNINVISPAISNHSSNYVELSNTQVEELMVDFNMEEFNNAVDTLIEEREMNEIAIKLEENYSNTL